MAKDGPTREERLSQALRANLAKRKAQVRGAAGEADAATPPCPPASSRP